MSSIAFKITGLSDSAKEHLLSITVTDEQGIKSDKVQIRFDDEHYSLQSPALGKEFEVYLGYKSGGPALTRLGIFQVDEIKFLETPAAMMEVSGNALFTYNNSMKAPTTKSWDKTTFGEVVNKIAIKHGYATEVDEDLKKLKFDHIDQSEESDIHLLTRVADEHDAFVKFQDKKLMIRSRSKTQGVVTIAKDGSLPTFSYPGMVVTVPSSVSVTENTRNKYESVKAYWQDKDKAKRTSETAGEGEPEFKIRKTFSSKAGANAAAEAKLQGLKRGTKTLDNLTAPGDPNIRAGMKLKLQGFRSEVNGSWIVTSVTHTLDGSSGYKVSLKGDWLPDEDVVINLKVLFDTNKAIVKPEYYTEIKSLADILRKDSSKKVELQGHTDSRNTKTYNLALSQRRANAVRDVLVRKFGISSGQVTTKGYGESQLLVSPENTADDYAKNRRVVAVISGG